MSYRSIKRAFEGSSLEQKILVLLCICLFVLIGTSFFWVNRITENLIRSGSEARAQDQFVAYLLNVHLTNCVVRPDLVRVKDEHLEVISQNIAGSKFEAEILTLEPGVSRWQIQPRRATDPVEISRLRSMIPAAQGKRQVQLLADKELAAPVPMEFSLSSDELQASDDFRSILRGDKFVFLKPIEFRRSCINCHFVGDQASQLELARLAEKDPAAADAKMLTDNQSAPIVFAKIEIPYRATKRAINRSRAILMAFAIVTAFLSVLALYAIIRRFIVKPLRHLRDVTEEVSHGRTDIRSNLETGDEFEELGRSMNRMLRHLLDAQSALSNANADLDKKVDEQAQLSLHLYEMNQIKSDFLANMSHELRTPLNSILGFSEVLENVDSLSERQKRYVNNIHTSGKLLLELINNLLDLAKIDAGKLEANPSEFSLSQLAVSVCDMVRGLAEKKNIQLVLQIKPDLPNIFQDQTKIKQILTNLLSNAIKFTPEGGRINVEIDRLANHRVIIRVADTGVGIAEGDRELVFEKFRQGPAVTGDNTLTREISGTGLGLSIVKELCILLGGSVELESEVGKGSIFTVSIPTNLRLVPRIRSEIAQSLDEITKYQRIDFARARHAQMPSANDSSNPPRGNPTADSSTAVTSESIEQ